MKKNVHLVMPMAGAGSRFFKDGYALPKPLLEIQGKPFFFWATQSIVKFVDVDLLIFVVLQEHVDRFKIDAEILSYYPTAMIEIIPTVLNGPVLTALEGVKHIEDEKPFIINDCDHMFKCDAFYNFCTEGNFGGIGGTVLSFVSNDPKFSFLKVNEQNEVIGTAEKLVISNQAICGVYWFESASVFKKTSELYFLNCNYSEYFVSGMYNVLVDQQKKVTFFTVDYHIPFGTPEEYKSALTSNLFDELL